MYLNYLVEIPDVKGKITYREKNGARYVYYEYDRTYNSEEKNTRVKRATIGKVSSDDATKMIPNENFQKYFSDVEMPEDAADYSRSSCLRSGTYMVLRKLIKELELDTKLASCVGKKDAGIILDFAAYSIITEDNAAQYYPDYAYNHPLFTEKMKIYSDSTISDFLKSIDENQRQKFLNLWNEDRNKREQIYISYDSTNKNCKAGDISMVEFGAAKVDTGSPIFNYAIGYDVNNREPLMYEKYPGSINDVSQLQCMVEKIQGYGYKNIGFILDRGYFSKDNIRYMDSNKFDFIIMVKGCKDFISAQVRAARGSFETNWTYSIPEFEVYGKTVHEYVYTADTRKRYVHIYYSAAKAARERSKLEAKVQEMKKYLEKHKDTNSEFNDIFNKYFHLHYNKETKNFVYAEPNLEVITDELELCGYFAIISSKKMTAEDAIGIYKSRDASEKVFKADKSYLGGNCLRTHSDEAAANKIFIGFIALIIRCRMYTLLKDAAKEMIKKPNYLTVPAAIRELEKIEITRQLDNVYRLDHAVTKTQKTILGAFGIDPGHVKPKADYISAILRGEIECQGI